MACHVPVSVIINTLFVLAMAYRKYLNSRKRLELPNRIIELDWRSFLIDVIDDTF